MAESTSQQSTKSKEVTFHIKLENRAIIESATNTTNQDQSNTKTGDNKKCAADNNHDQPRENEEMYINSHASSERIAVLPEINNVIKEQPKAAQVIIMPETSTMTQQRPITEGPDQYIENIEIAAGNPSLEDSEAAKGRDKYCCESWNYCLNVDPYFNYFNSMLHGLAICCCIHQTCDCTFCDDCGDFICGDFGDCGDCGDIDIVA